MAGVDSSRYPDDQCRELRVALAAQLGSGVDNIVVGNGSAELIWLLALAYLRPDDTVLIVGPTFGEYERAAAVHGARAVVYRAQESEDFLPDVTEIIGLVQSQTPRLVFLCNPNNPTGFYLRSDSVERLLAACDDSLLVVDEAYIGFVSGPDCLLDLVDRGAVLLRSMTKDCGLAGLRLGYAVASQEVSETLTKVRPPWSVNAVAQAAGLAALADVQHLATAREAVAESKTYLAAELTRLGLRVVPSAANFVMVRVGDARRFRAALLARRCCVRDCTSFSLPEFIRIGVRPLADCRTLVTAIREAMRAS